MVGGLCMKQMILNIDFDLRCWISAPNFTKIWLVLFKKSTNFTNEWTNKQMRSILPHCHRLYARSFLSGFYFHMGRNSGWHFGQCLPPTECHHRGQCGWECSCQKDQQIQFTQLDTRLLSSCLRNIRPLECQRSGVRGSNRKAFDRGDDWPSRNYLSVPMLVCPRPAFQCGLPSRHVPNFRVRTVIIPDTFYSFS